MPKERVSQFKANLNAYQESEKPLSRWGSYTVQPGEKPASIADKFKMSLAQLQEANGISMKSLSKPGQPLLVLTDSAPEATQAANSLTSMNDNTPVNVTESDKPAAKNSARTEDSDTAKVKPASTGKTADSDKNPLPASTGKNSKDVKTLKAAVADKKSGKPSTSAKSTKTTEPAKPSGNSTKPSSKPVNKSGDSKAGSKNNGKSGKS